MGRSGRGTSSDGGAGLLAFRIHHSGDSPGEALALAEHATEDEQATDPDDDREDEKEPEQRVIAHAPILPHRSLVASAAISIRLGVNLLARDH